MTSWRERLMGKEKPQAKAPAKAKRKATAKRRHRTSIRTMKADLEGILDDLIKLASTDPYLTDAQAMLSQAIVFIEKQIVTEVGDKPVTPPEQEPGPDEASLGASGGMVERSGPESRGHRSLPFSCSKRLESRPHWGNRRKKPMPRKSVAALSVVAKTKIDGRPRAPADLSPEQHRIWERVVASEPADLFATEATRQLLKDYCRRITALDYFTKQIDFHIEMALLPAEQRPEGVELLSVRQMDKLMLIRSRETAGVIDIATKLRLTNQARYSAKAMGVAGRRAANPDPADDKKPWHPQHKSRHSQHQVDRGVLRRSRRQGSRQASQAASVAEARPEEDLRQSCDHSHCDHQLREEERQDEPRSDAAAAPHLRP